MLGTREKMEAHAHSASPALLNIEWGLVIVQTADLIPCIQLIASPSVNVTLGTREKMEAHAHSASKALIKWAWGLLIAQIVHQTLRRQLEASQTLRVNVTLVTRSKMQARAPSAMQAPIKLDSGLIV